MFQDFSDILSELNAAGARYLLVGGHAMAVHSIPRATKDLDIWIEPTPANARRVYAALARFGAPLQALTVEDLATEGIVFQIGIPPIRIDILTAISGVSFKSAWPSRVAATFLGQPVFVIGRRHLIKNKEASGRPQDLVDAGVLRKIGD
jgi:hypothetical protein